MVSLPMVEIHPSLPNRPLLLLLLALAAPLAALFGAVCHALLRRPPGQRREQLELPLGAGNSVVRLRAGAD